MSFAAAFAYEVDPAAAAKFEAAYGPDGEWARFFARGDGYLGTDLWRAGEAAPRRYLLLDRWRSEADYEAFLRLHGDEYRARSEVAEALYVHETVLGRFGAAGAAAGAVGDDAEGER